MGRPYRDNDEDRDAFKKMVVYCVLTASVVVLAFLWMLYLNNEERHERLAEKSSTEEKELSELKAANQEMDDLGVGRNNLRSEDLDFWDLYDGEKPAETEEEEEGTTSQQQKTPSSKTSSKTTPGTQSKTASEKKDSGNDGTGDEGESSEAIAGDGKHIGIAEKDGDIIYYEIMDTVPANEYDLENDLTLKDGRLVYNDGDFNAPTGITVSKNQGIIDWTKAKADGISFAMIKVAYRGYESGIISLDENFVINARGAAANGIAIGTYFSTQAVNETEATEEANFTVGAIAQYGVTYPVAVYIEDIKNDRTRTDELTMEERSALVKIYLDTVKSFGFSPMIMGERDALIRDVDLSKLSDYPIFLIDPLDYDLASKEGLSVKRPETGSQSIAPGNASTSSGTFGSTDNRIVSSASYDVKDLGSSKKKDSAVVISEEEGPVVSEPEKKWYTDFPYRFSVWQYDPGGTVSGVSGSVPVDIGFIDYSRR